MRLKFGIVYMYTVHLDIRLSLEKQRIDWKPVRLVIFPIPTPHRVEPATMHTSDKNDQVVYEFKPRATGNITYNNYPELQSKINGGLQILIGVLFVIVESVDLYYLLAEYRLLTLLQLNYYVTAAVFIAAGSLGISAGRKNTKFLILAFMVLSLIAVVFVVFGLMLYALSGVKLDFLYVILGENVCNEEGTRYDRNACSHANNVIEGTKYFRLTMYILEGVVSIWASILCCRAMCCGAHERVTGVLYTTSSKTGGSAPNQA